MLATTWLDLVGPVCIFLDGKWQNGNLDEIHKDRVVFSVSGDPTQFMMSKDEAYSCIRSRKIVNASEKQAKYNGKNAMVVFGPAGVNMYGKKIVERTDRPNHYRVIVKYKPQKYSKVQHIRIPLGKHVSCFAFCCFLLLLCRFIACVCTACNINVDSAANNNVVACTHSYAIVLSCCCCTHAGEFRICGDAL